MRCLLLLLLLAPQALVADETLYRLINERLSLMKQVAAYKWINQQPIAVPQRETIVIRKAVSDGLQYGVTVSSSGTFFSAHIEAARDIQQCWFDRWMSGNEPTSAEDLEHIIRPKLIILGSEIISRLSDNDNDRHRFNRIFTIDQPVDCLSEGGRQTIFDALENIFVYPNRHAQILDSGQLRIGTTGDYAPFSYATDGTDFSGIDIDLGIDLARTLGVTPVFVRTSWPMLMSDLAAGLFDVGMSGISIIPERQQFAYFSASYHVGGKSPITLCSRVEEFDSLEKINQPGIRVIVNPGGTNEKFLDATLNQVTKILYADNRTIFDAILAGTADVMVTDLIEVRLQVNRHQQLCSAMPDTTLTYQEKGYLMPRDPSLRDSVNQWLENARSQKLLEKVFARHLR